MKKNKGQVGLNENPRTLFLRATLIALGLLYVLKPGIILAQSSTSPLTFINSTVISGTAGSVDAVYKFQNVTSGVDAHVRLSAKYNGATVSNVDIPSSTTGYDPAFQPNISIANGTSGSPKTSYVEWEIRFKKAGTDTDTSLANISATAIDVDGNSNLQEKVQAYTPSSYSVNSPNELTLSTDGSSVTALGSTTDYSGMDSSVKAVMFQMNFQNVNLITYRTGGVSKTSTTARQFSIYFKAFFAQNTPLPVELMYFKATLNSESKVKLNWATASETNNAYFVVERSDDGREFYEIKALPGAGNSSKTNYYAFVDESPSEGLNYYRLIQTDHDGNQKVYDPVSVNIIPKRKDLVIDNVYPNPFKASTRITFSAPTRDEVQISVLNSQGMETKSIRAESVSGTQLWSLTGLQELEPGVYFLQASQNGLVSKTFRLMKN